MLNTVKVPKQFEPIFQKAQDYVNKYFKKRKEDPSKGTIEIFGERYILVRAASMSIDFFESIKNLYKDQGEEEAFNVARQLLFDIAHAIGKQDAKNFHKKMELKDPIEKLSAGPVHFSHSGWAFVDIFAESRPAPDESYYLIYDHPFSFESDAWLRSARKSDFPVCVMNAGYSSGWCEESFGLPLVASEIMCRAKGDDACRFIMAHPSKIEGYIGNYLKKEPKLAKKITKYEIPGFFKRKEMERALRESEEKYRAFFNTAKDSIFINDETGKFIDVNPAACESLGYSKEELLKLSNKEIDLETVGYEASQKVRDTSAQKVMFEVNQKRKDGLFLPVEITKTFFSVGSQRFSLLIARDITERKRAEAALLKANEELEQRVKERTAELAKALNEQKNIMDTIPDIIYMLDINGKLVKWNKKGEIITGFSSEELMGKSVLDFFPERDKITITMAIQEALVKGFSEVEGHLLRKDGIMVSYEWTGVPYKDEQDNVIGLIGVGRDITERKRAEEVLRESEERYRLLFNNSNDAIFIIDFDGNFLEVNQVTCDRLGRSSEELLRMRVAEIDSPDYAAIVSSRIEIVRTKGSAVFETAHVRADGTVFPVEISTRVISYQSRPALLSIARDITERKRAEENIKESEKKFKTIFNNATDGILLADIETKKFYLGNEAVCQMLGYSLDEIKTLGIEEIHPEKDLPYVTEQFEKQRRKEIFIARDIPLKKKDESVIYVDINSVPITLGERTYMLGMFRDITDRRKAEEKLQAEKERFWLAAQSLSDVIYEWDMGDSVQWFGNIDELLGYAPGEFPRTLEAWMDILHPEDQDRVWTAVERHRRGEAAYEIEYRVRHNNGAWRHWLARGSVLSDANGKPYRWVGAVTDITERKQAEEELTKYREHLEELIEARTAQLEAANRELEAFSYSVSHDLKAPLRAIAGFSSILVEDHCDKLDDEGKRLLNVVRGNTQKMGELIEDLLALSRIGRKEIDLLKIDMDKLAKAVFDEIKATVPEREIQFDIKPLPPAYGDAGLLQQVFFNLLFNAIKFTRFRENAIIEVGGYVEGPENVYYVQDNGVGFDMQYADKLFGAFQQLHSEQFEGTGIGLATVQRIIHRHGGRIWAEGKVNKGATFYFSLPKRSSKN